MIGDPRRGGQRPSLGWQLAGLRDKIVAKHPAIDNAGRVDRIGAFALDGRTASSQLESWNPHRPLWEHSVPKTISIPSTPAAPPSPFKNPTYPQRIHYGERAALVDILRSCDERLEGFRKKLDVLGQSAERAAYERRFLQLQGARDQVADTIRRMPIEAGELYHEDRERLQAAIEAFDRIEARWSA
jgi:hypothetical protein